MEDRFNPFKFVILMNGYNIFRLKNLICLMAVAYSESFNVQRH